MLFEEPEPAPIKPLVFTTLAPLLITRLLLLPNVPTKSAPVLLQVDPFPVTVTMLLEDPES